MYVIPYTVYYNNLIINNCKIIKYTINIMIIRIYYRNSVLSENNYQ